METVSKVVDGVFYALNINRTATHLEFTCQPPTFALVQCVHDGTWNTVVVALDGTKAVVIPADPRLIYYVTYGLTQAMADIYHAISPPEPENRPVYRTIIGDIVACKAVNWYRMFNGGSNTYYLYNADAVCEPEALLPETASRPYHHDTDIHLRDNPNYQHLFQRDLTDRELRALIPVDVIRNIYKFSRTSRLNWMPAKDYIWTGTLTLVDTLGMEFIFTDEWNNTFVYNHEHLKMCVKHLVHGKLSGNFIFKAVITGKHLNYVPVPVNACINTQVPTQNEMQITETDSD